MIQLRATSYSATSTDFTITVSPFCTCENNLSTLYNGQKFFLITCLPFPTISTVVPVQISINGTTYPVLDCFGNTLMSDQIRSRRRYCLVFGTYKGQFQVKQYLCPSQIDPSSVSTTPSSASTVSN